MESNTGGKRSYKPKGNLSSRHKTSLTTATEEPPNLTTDASTSDLTSACLDGNSDSQPTSNVTEEVIQQTSMDTSTNAKPASSEIKESNMETDVDASTTDTATITYSKPIKEWTKEMSTQIQNLLKSERQKHPGTEDIPEDDPLPEIKIEKKHMLKSASMEEASSKISSFLSASQATPTRSEAEKMATRKWIEDLIAEIDNETEDVVLIVPTSKDRPPKLRKKKTKARRSRTKTHPKATASPASETKSTLVSTSSSTTLASTLATISASSLENISASSTPSPITTFVSSFSSTSADTLITTFANIPVTASVSTLVTTTVYSPLVATTLVHTSVTASTSTIKTTSAGTFETISVRSPITTPVSIPVTTSVCSPFLTRTFVSNSIKTAMSKMKSSASASALATTSASFPVATSVDSQFLATTSACTSMGTKSASALATVSPTAFTTMVGTFGTNYATSASSPVTSSVHSHFLAMTSASTSLISSMSTLASTSVCSQFITTPSIITTMSALATTSPSALFASNSASTFETTAGGDFEFDYKDLYNPYSKHYIWSYSKKDCKENRPFPLPIATETLKEVDSEVTNYPPKFEIELPLHTETPTSTSNVDTLSEEKILKAVKSKDYSFKQPKKKFKTKGPATLKRDADISKKIKTEMKPSSISASTSLSKSASTLTSASATRSVSTPTISESTLNIPTTNVDTVFENTSLEDTHSKDTSSKHLKKKSKGQNPSFMDSDITVGVPSLTQVKPRTCTRSTNTTSTLERIPSISTVTSPNIDKDGDSKDSSRSHGKKKWKHQRARSLKEKISDVTEVTARACTSPSTSADLLLPCTSSLTTTSASIPETSSTPATIPLSRSLLCLESVFAEAASTSTPESTSTRKKSKKIRAKNIVYDDVKEKECFIPKEKVRLIYLLLNSAVNIQNLVYEWECLCRQREFIGILYMLQFITDLAGFYEFNFIHHYLVTEMRIELIIPKMERCVPDFMKEHGFLLNANSSWSKQAQKTVYEFVRELVQAIERHFLVSNSDVLCEMFRLLDFMSVSKQPAIKFTGIALALKLGVGLANYLEIIRPKLQLLKMETTRKVDSKLIILDKKVTYAMNLLKYLCFIAVSNCMDTDITLENLRVLCLQDVFTILLMQPEKYYAEAFLIVLAKFLVDESKKVRASAFESLRKLLTENILRPMFHEFPEEILLTLCERVREAHWDEVILSINLLKIGLQVYPNISIPQTTANDILNKVYDPNYLIAAAAGDFLKTLLRMYPIIKSPAKFLKDLVILRHRHNTEDKTKADLTAVLVESLIDCTQELQSYQLIISLLFEKEGMKFIYQVTLLEILTHTVYQVITGRSRVLRTNYRKGEIDISKRRTIMSHIFPNLVRLFLKFGKVEQCQKNILEMLVLFNYKDDPFPQYKQLMLEGFKLLHKLFFETNNRDIQEMIIKVFILNTDDLCVLKYEASKHLKTITGKVIRTYNFYMRQDAKQYLQDDVNRFQQVLGRMCVMYKCCKMNYEWTFGVVPSFAQHIPLPIDTIFCIDLECGLYYMICHLKQFLEKEYIDSKESVAKIKAKCNRFFGICFHYLKTSKSDSVKIQAFECICDLANEIIVMVEEPRKTHPNLEDLKPVIRDQSYEKCIRDFLLKYIFDKPVKTHHGEVLLAKFICGVFDKILPVTLFEDMFCFYYKYYKVYETLFNSCLLKLKNVNTRLHVTVIMATLISTYTGLPNRTDFNTQEAKEMKRLIIQFGIHLTSEDVMELLRMGIIYALADERTIPILHFLGMFCNRMNDDEKQKTLDFFRKSTKAGQEANKYMIDFKRRLEIRRLEQ